MSVKECAPDGVSESPKHNLIIPTLLSGEQNFEIKQLPLHTKLYLYNNLGQLIYRNENYNNEFNAITTKPGVYYYNLQLEDGSVLKGKLCVVK